MSLPIVNEKITQDLPVPVAIQVFADERSRREHQLRSRKVAGRWLRAVILTNVFFYFLLKTGFISFDSFHFGQLEPDSFAALRNVYDVSCSDRLITDPDSLGLDLHHVPSDEDAGLWVVMDGPAVGTGTVIIQEKVDIRPNTSVGIRVLAGSSRADALPGVRLCDLISKEPGQEKRGSVVLVEPRFAVNSELVIELMTPADGTHLPISLQMTTPGLKYWIPNLGLNGMFRKVEILSQNGAIDAGSIRAEEIALKTSNFPITGSFEVERHLDLVTSNAMIDITIGMTNRRSSARTSVNMHTTNAPILASIDLSAPDADEGFFFVDGRTTNAPVTVNYQSSPDYITLGSHLVTTNGRIELGLPPAYEGSLFGQTTNFLANIDFMGDITDPSGKGRHRSLSGHTVSGNSVRGSVSWDGRWHSHGSSNAITTNAPVHIRL